MEIKRIGIASAAMFGGVLYALMALVFGWPLLIFEAAETGGGVVLWMLVILFGMIGGVVKGALFAVVYNVVARLSTGLEVQLVE